MKARCILWLAALFTMGLQAGTLPELVLPNTVGVNIHFNRGHERDLDMMAAAGFRVARMDLGWAGVERERGVYDWSAYDELTSNLLKRGVRPYYILDYSNPLYEETVTSKNPITGEEHKDTASPQKPESIAAFAKWAAAAAARFADKNVIWEIWNEPNITFWKPKPDVQQYIALAQATCKAVRAADPHAIIVGPATSEVPVKFLEEFFRSGILEQFDAVSVHPYRNYKKGPETAGEDYKKIRELIARYAPESKKQMPILSGEWGYATHTKGVPTEIQAAFLVRQQLYNFYEKIPVSIWYDWKNDGPDEKNGEHNFGTVTQDLQPKPAYTALQVMTRQLDRCRISERIKTENESDYVLLFTGEGGKSKLAVWTAGEPHDMVLRAETKWPENVRGAKGQGETFELKPDGNDISVHLEALPQYLELDPAVKVQSRHSK